MIPITLTLVLALLTKAFLFYIILMLALIAALLLSGISLSTLLRNFKPLILLVGVTVLYHLIFSGAESETWLSLFGWNIKIGALEMAAFYSLRLILFVSIAFLMTLTSSPSDLAEALSRVLQPLKKLKVPVNDLSLILFMAIRFIPVLYEEFIAIRNAQVMRGVDFGGSWINRIRKSVFIIIPVFVAAIQRADDIALAIEARGYDSNIERTSYNSSQFGSSEIVFSVLSSFAIFTLFFVLK